MSFSAPANRPRTNPWRSMRWRATVVLPDPIKPLRPITIMKGRLRLDLYGLNRYCFFRARFGIPSVRRTTPDQNINFARQKSPVRCFPGPPGAPILQPTREQKAPFEILYLAISGGRASPAWGRALAGPKVLQLCEMLEAGKRCEELDHGC